MRKAVREAVNENSVSFQFGTQQRSSFYYRHAVELARNGRIGEVKTIMVGSVRGPNDTLYGTPKEPPPSFDYLAARIEDLPPEAREYVLFVEQMAGVPVTFVSVGPGRELTVVLPRAA